MKAWTELCGKSSLGVSYHGRKNHVYGWQVNLNKDDVKKSLHAFAFEGKHNDLTVKGKVDC